MLHAMEGPTGRAGIAPSDPDYDISDRAALEALRRAEDRHFWQVSRARMIARRLSKLGLRRGASLLDLGCGMGCVSAVLARAGYQVTGVDGHQRLLDVAAQRSPESRFLCRDLRQGVGDLGNASSDAAGLFDVIEHMAEPMAALEGALSCVRPGGLLVGTVPALMWLWSSIDNSSGHKVRYERDTLRRVLIQVRGAALLSIAPFNRVLVPLLWLHRRRVGRGQSRSVENLTVPWGPVNAAMLALLNFENALAPALDATPLPGASLWFALRKQL
jgi:2-polyprenyl-3-methyl-5-hydroxy-6-metoxy-1,4-benzoquinol methylase